MSESRSTDEAVQRVKDAFDSAAAEAGEFTDEVRQEFEEAIDELEGKIDRLRD